MNHTRAGFTIRAVGEVKCFCSRGKFIEAHDSSTFDVSIYRQESNPTSWKMCAMNLAVHRIEVDLGKFNADTFHKDQHKDL